MSASKIYSNMRVEADQKDVIIARLKEEIYHLKKNEQQYFLLEDQYRGLEHKYKLLIDEKNVSDVDFKNRHESAIRTINGLKAQSDDLKAELRDRNLEVNDLVTDENTLKNQLDQRTIEIEKLKGELNSLFADADQLAVARAHLQETADKTRLTNAGLNERLNSLDHENDNVQKRIADTTRYLDQLLVQEKALRDKILVYENENNRLDGNINGVTEDIMVIDGRILQAHNQIKDLQKDIAETTALCEKFKSQALHYQKATQAEVMKNNDTTKMLSHAQHTLKTRINQTEEGRREVAVLREQTGNLDNINRRLEDDLEFCRKHLETLALLNQDIVLNLQRFSDEDEEVRRLIDRRGTVQKVRVRTQQAGSLLNRTTVSTNADRSPFKRSKMAY